MHTPPPKCAGLWVRRQSWSGSHFGCLLNVHQEQLERTTPQKHHHNPSVLPGLCYELPSFNQPLLKEEESGLHCRSGSGHPRARSGGLFPWPHHTTSTRERVTRSLVGLAMTASLPRPEGDSEQALRAKKNVQENETCTVCPRCLLTYAKSTEDVLLPAPPIYYTSHNLW